MNKVKASKENKNVFNDLNKFLIDINNHKVKYEDAVERLNKSISDLNQSNKKQSIVLRNKTVQIVYQLLNSFDFNKKFEPFSSQTKSEQAEEKMQIPLWFRINKSEFYELTSDIYDNQINKDFKITINKKTYDLKNGKTFWTKIAKSKVSKNEAKKLYKESIQKDIDALEREKSNSIKKKLFKNSQKHRCNIYWHLLALQKLTKKANFERNIAQGVKLRKQRLHIIDKKKENINNELFNHYFGYSNPIIMLERLRDASDEKK